MDFKYPSINELKKNILSDLKESLGDPRYFLGVSPLVAISQALSGVAFMLHAHIDHIAKYQLLPDQAKGESLKRWAKILGLTHAHNENEERLRERVLFRLTHPARGGTKADYIQWVMDQFQTVKNVWVYDVYKGPGTIGITCSMDNELNPFPSDEFCTNSLKPFIESVKPLGIQVDVFSPKKKIVQFQIRTTAKQQRPKVEEALRHLVFNYGHPEKIISRSRVIQTISQVLQGESFDLPMPNEDVAILRGELGEGEIIWL